jgi:hypothetical protein
MLTPQEKGRLYEKELARSGRAKLQPLSGATWGRKEDLYTDPELIQAKWHEPSKTMSIKQEWLDDVHRHAAQVGRIGVVFLSWNNSEYVIIRRKDYDNMSFNKWCKTCWEEEPVFCKACGANDGNRTETYETNKRK